MEQLDISRNEKLSKIKKDPLKIIPKKVITYSIAKYLYRSDLLSCSLVSSSWKTVFSDNVLWKKCFFSFFEYTEIEGVDKKYEEMFSLLFSVPNYWKKMYFFFLFFLFFLFLFCFLFLQWIDLERWTDWFILKTIISEILIYNHFNS